MTSSDTLLNVCVISLSMIDSIQHMQDCQTHHELNALYSHSNRGGLHCSLNKDVVE